MNNAYSSATGVDGLHLLPTQRLQLEPSQRQAVQTILAQLVPHAQVFAFGSRVSGSPRKYSDLNLAIVMPQPLSLRNLSQLKASFEDSDIPICIDLVDWQQADPSFKSAVTAQGMVVLQTS
jgi:uncharacterized protein